MNKDIKTTATKYLFSLIEFIKRYKLEAFLISVLIIFGFLLLRISQYSTREPSDDAVTEKIKTVRIPKIDDEAIEKIENLEDQNIEVQSLFNDARNNPFSE